MKFARRIYTHLGRKRLTLVWERCCFRDPCRKAYKVIYEFSFLSKNFQVPHFISIPLPSSVGNGCLLIKVLILEILIPLHNNLIFAERFFHECPMTTMQKMLSITSSASPLEWLRVWDGAKMNLSLRNR